jgi:protein-tyrosine phosphatase
VAQAMTENRDSAFEQDDERSTISWITEEIAIGNYLAAQDTELLKREGISSVVSLDGTLAGRAPPDLELRIIEAFTFVDGPGNDLRLFRAAVDAVSRCVKETGKVLVHCHAGRSRSAIVVAGYLMQSRGLDPEQALDVVRAKRVINVSSGLERLLETTER